MDIKPISHNKNNNPLMFTMYINIILFRGCEMFFTVATVLNAIFYLLVAQNIVVNDWVGKSAKNIFTK